MSNNENRAVKPRKPKSQSLVQGTTYKAALHSVQDVTSRNQKLYRLLSQQPGTLLISQHNTWTVLRTLVPSRRRRHCKLMCAGPVLGWAWKSYKWCGKRETKLLLEQHWLGELDVLDVKRHWRVRRRGGGYVGRVLMSAIGLDMKPWRKGYEDVDFVYITK